VRGVGREWARERREGVGGEGGGYGMCMREGGVGRGVGCGFEGVVGCRQVVGVGVVGG